MFYHINTLPSQASFHPCLSKPHQQKAGCAVEVSLLMWCRWQHVKKNKNKKGHLYSRHADSLDDWPSQTKKPCRVPPEMFLQSQGSPSRVPFARSPCLNAVTST